MSAVEYGFIVLILVAVIGTLAFAGHRLESSTGKAQRGMEIGIVTPDADPDPQGNASPFGEILAKTDWFPAEIMPVHVGPYEVRMPLRSVEMINMAAWDGKKWCDPINGRECYFQRVEWRGIKIESLAVSEKLAYAYRTGGPLGFIDLI
ncbi:hypothetical protein [Noviherbaspirillum saxi]|uniref:Uncharacterized protein n=1 Tax=Noviherbaspirillum saxi TaxID=2320863 RepID=A0A3A3GA64_9BURK|nr:hypothetical protein [Noviherbaspirillum saxi]RJF99045.1 hypothetical protein D3871_11375 [Noviherbaspirillum saxi]